MLLYSSDDFLLIGQKEIVAGVATVVAKGGLLGRIIIIINNKSKSVKKTPQPCGVLSRFGPIRGQEWHKST